MIYDYKDNHPIIKAIKSKGWAIFEVYSSKSKGECAGWRIDASIAHSTKHEETHRKINGLFLGFTLNDSLKNVFSDKFPSNNIIKNQPTPHSLT